MSTFLELCQDVARESGTISGTQPTTVASQTGRLAKIVDWTIDAWRRIQNDRNAWKWMRTEFSGSITSGTARYTAASFSLSRHARWLTDANNLTIYKTATGVSDESALTVISWDTWRQTYGRGSQTNNRPVSYAVSPSGELCFGPIPDDSYTINGEYYKSPQILADNTDEPECPARFHQIIVQRALVSLAEHDEALVTAAAAQKNYNEIMLDLESDQLPTIALG